MSALRCRLAQRSQCMLHRLASGTARMASAATSPTASLAKTSEAAAAVAGASARPASSSASKITVRPSDARGHADHGWLSSSHTFSFAGYHDHRFDGFGPLRVINEDFVQGSFGFGKHSHSNFLIFSYPLSGALRHVDSLGNTERVGRGAVQFTAAGTGISHSEANISGSDPVHFLQIWLQPHRRGEKPRYVTRHFADEEKRNALRPIVTADGADKTIVSGRGDVAVYACILEDGERVTHTFRGGRGYIHVPKVPGTQGVTVNGERLRPGDGAFIVDADTVAITAHADKDASRKSGRSLRVSRSIDGAFDYGSVPGTEFLLFDMA
ncbi:hypothetical protein FNF29_05341 [Cafeteria roenbergensis]|uniref:Pirin N-terminal domain-containing protein n=1 Tax=Cafeteria roenbergensis TaxID=33653 RepID=A0A5A8CCE3_CAFRO|nr:hypothetical protein FNF29_05341 [Cafeteria roenbergensis]|eukprot:KAA0150329.1 hypothetical protein FNF29_05341 [Cafeteria roenbergensis]